MALTPNYRGTYDAFNPQVQETRDPNWLNQSKEISNFKKVSSAAVGIEEAGKMFKEGVQGTDEVIKAFADKDLNERIDPLRDSYTQSLSDIEARERGAAVGRAGGEGTADNSVLPPGQNGVQPSELKRLPTTLDILEGARANGHISPTHYIAALGMVASDMRSYYPLHRDYIDKQIARKTGIDPANDLIKSLTADINSFMGNQKTAKDKIANEILQNIKYSPTLTGVYTGVVNGTIPPEKGLQILNEFMYDHYKTEDARGKLALEEAKRGEAVEGVKQVVRLEAAGQTNAIVNTLFAGVKSAEDLTTALRDTDPATLRDRVATMRQTLLESANRIRAKFEMPDEKAGIDTVTGRPRTLASMLPEGEIDRIIKASQTIPNMYLDMLEKGEFAPANFVQYQNKAMLAQGMNDVLKSKEFKDLIPFWNSIRESLGPNAMERLAPELTLELRNKYGAWANERSIRAMGGAKDASLTQDMSDSDNLRKLGIEPGPANDRLIQVVKKIEDKTIDPVTRAKLVDYAFKEENLQLFHNMEEDGIDPHTGRKTPGRYSVYQKLGTDEFMNSVKEIGPDAWNKYRRIMSSAYSNDILLPGVQELSKIQNTPQMAISWHPDNTGTPRFGVDVGKYKDVNLTGLSKVPTLGPYAGEARANAAAASRVINNLNTGVDVITRMAKLDGEADPSKFAIGYLIQIGFDPTVGTVEGVGQELIDAITTERNKKEQEAKKARTGYEKKDQSKAPSGRTPSLGE